MLIHRSFDPAKILDDLVEFSVTHISLVPVMLLKLLEYSEQLAPPSLKTVLIGGDKLPKFLAEQAVARGWPLVVSYGMTETASRITMLRLNRQNIRQWDEANVGKPLPGINLTIGDNDEVRVNSSALFKDDLFEFVSGDRGYVDDEGFLHIHGRLDERIITGGETVDPLVVEGLLLKHQNINKAVISSVPDKIWGEQIVAKLEIDSDTEQNRRAIREWIAREIPAYLRPRNMLFNARVLT